MTFWETPAWHAYEKAYGHEPGTRAKLLADAHWQTHVFDLTPDEATLWRGIRKSAKSLIHRAEASHDLRVNSLDAWTLAAGIHRQAAGRTTRDLRTWALMGEWMSDGKGLFVLSSLPKAPAPDGFVFFAIHETWAYYFSAATLAPDINQALIWAGIKALKARGVTTLELGWQGHATDEKGKAIEFFRRGFGGETMTFQELYGGSTCRLQPGGVTVGSSPAASTT